jgi:diguanylate cyclase (GGDEF)-like protein
MVDIDRFKEINDVHGHTTGDSALEAIASALVRIFPRRSDVVTRFGGDEFAVILRDATAADGGRLAERFLAAVRQLEVPGPRGAVKVTVSVGVAEALPGEPADNWLARTDRALYEAKARGRDCVAIDTDEPVDGSRVAA